MNRDTHLNRLNYTPKSFFTRIIKIHHFLNSFPKLTKENKVANKTIFLFDNFILINIGKRELCLKIINPLLKP